MVYATNLQRRNGTYYFRVRIPADLRHWFGRDEIKKSLRTKRLTHARGIHKLLDYRTERLFTLMRTGLLTDAQIRKLKDEYIRETLAETDKARLQDGPQLIRDADTGRADTATPYSDLAEEGFKVLEGGNSKKIDRIMAEFLGKKGVSLDPTSLDYLKLRREIADAFITVMQIDQKRDLGDFSDPYHLPDEPEKAEDPSPIPAPASPPAHRLSKVIEKYLEDLKSHGNCSQNSLKEYEGICSRLLWIFGDKDIQSITRDEIRHFRDALPKLPKHLNKKKEYKGKTLQQVLKMNFPEVIGKVQVNKYIMHLKAVFKWAEAEGWITDNPTGVLKVFKEEQRADEQRKAYSKEDLQRLVTGLVLEDANGGLEGHPERFWVPLIGVFSGMRANEICQLQIDDVAEEEGIWHFIVKGGGDRSVKTSAANRSVPIHPALIELGFLDYFKAMKAMKAPRLWMSLKPTSRGYRRSFSNWFNGTGNAIGFNRKHVTEDPKIVFHSLRHTFRNEMKQKLVDVHIADEVVGHSHGSLGMDRYGKAYGLRLKLEAVEKVDYGLNLKSLIQIARNYIP